jgi:oligopeptide/dipeptide ABC transporter ATP-binding protein
MVHLPTKRGVVQAVDGVSFVLRKGKTLGIVGESGSGKSMLGRTIMGLLPGNAILSPRSEVIFQGASLLRLSPKQRRDISGNEIAMVFQDPMTALNPVRRIGHQIAEGMRQHQSMKKIDAWDRAAHLLQKVGIDCPAARLRHYPHQLSGGQRQRVAIAIALACSPKLLIADEPTSALDVTVQAEILDLLSRHRRCEGMAMLLISHDLSIVAGHTDEIAVMYAGQIVEFRSTQELFQDPRMPYTKALLAAMPLLSKPAHGDLATIGGLPPDLVAPSPGCRFSPRCPRRREKCCAVTPPFEPMNGSLYGYACWYPLDSNDQRLLPRRVAARR